MPTGKTTFYFAQPLPRNIILQLRKAFDDEIRIRVARNDPETYVMMYKYPIGDNGIGIALATIDEIVSPFY